MSNPLDAAPLIPTQSTKRRTSLPRPCEAWERSPQRFELPLNSPRAQISGNAFVRGVQAAFCAPRQAPGAFRIKKPAPMRALSRRKNKSSANTNNAMPVRSWNKPSILSIPR